MTPEFLASAPRLTGGSLTLAQVGLALMLAGGIGSCFPLWKSTTLSPDSIERRTYWTGMGTGLTLCFAACAPDWRLAVFSTLILGIGAVVIAFFKSNHIKINGRIYAADASKREPDRPPALAKNDENPY